MPVAGIVGDQQAALFGQTCFERGEAKNTYGTGSFLLVNTGEQIVRSQALLTSVAAQVGERPPRYVLEGSIAVTGAAVQWLRDQLGLIDTAAAGGGAGAQRAGQRRRVLRARLLGAVRAVLARRRPRRDRGPDRVRARRRTSRARCSRRPRGRRARCSTPCAPTPGVELRELRVDGGMTANELLMQLQADVLGMPVVRPRVTETTALGAAFAAGLAVGFWSDEAELRARWSLDRRWEPQMDEDTREREHAQWRKAVERSLGWVD